MKRISMAEGIFEINGGTKCVGLAFGSRRSLAIKSIKDSGTLSIPEGIKEVTKDAFLGFKDVLHVNLPSTLEYVGTEAFAHTSISEIHIPDSKKKTSIQTQQMSFGNCPNLTKLIVDSERTAKSIHCNAFLGSPIREVVVDGNSYPCFAMDFGIKFYIARGTIKAVGSSSENMARIVERTQSWFDGFMAIPTENLLGGFEIPTKNAPPPGSTQFLVEWRLKGFI